jgi:hypothetical protein
MAVEAVVRWICKPTLGAVDVAEDAVDGLFSRVELALVAGDVVEALGDGGVLGVVEGKVAVNYLDFVAGFLHLASAGAVLELKAGGTHGGGHAAEEDRLGHHISRVLSKDKC